MFQNLEERFWRMMKRGQRAKEMVIGEQTEVLDKFTAYVWANELMPSRLNLSRYRALCLFAEFYSRRMMKGASLCEGLVHGLHESTMSGFAAVPRAIVDMDEGNYDVFLTGPPGGSQGGLDDIPVEK